MLHLEQPKLVAFHPNSSEAEGLNKVCYIGENIVKDDKKTVKRDKHNVLHSVKERKSINSRLLSNSYAFREAMSLMK